MARSRTASSPTARPARAATLALGPGLHAARVERIVTASGEGVPRSVYQILLPTGLRTTATLDPGVAAALVEECLRQGRSVVVTEGAGGVVIVGALQTAPYPVADERGTLVLDARHLRLRATDTLELEVPGTSLRLEPGGAVRIDGDRLVIDMAALVRIFSGRVEIP
jgi:hypothetical protein